MSILLLRQTLAQVQGTSQHEIHIRTAKEIYKKVDHVEFMLTIKRGLDCWIKYDNNIDFAENGIAFLISFVISFEIDETNDARPVLTSILDHLLEISQKKSYIVRKRVCQVLFQLFREKRDIIEQEALDKIVDCMKVLMKDKSKAVRANATKFLLNFNDTSEIIQEILLFHLEADPYKEVRNLILKSLIPSEETFSMIISRAKDIETEIRFSAITLLGKYDVKELTVAERLEILRCGIDDPTETIKTYFSAEILPAWLQQFGGNHLELLSSFKTGNSAPEIMEFHSILKRIMELFQQTSLIKLAGEIPLFAAEPFLKCVPVNKLTIETAVCWSALIDVAGKSTLNGSADILICDLTTFFQYIKRFMQFVEEDEETTENLLEEEIQFILLILIKMIGKLNYSDEYTRNSFIAFIDDMLKNQLELLTEEMIQILVEYARKLLPLDSLDEYITNLIDDLRNLFQPHTLDRISSIAEMIDNETQRMNIFTIKRQILELNETLIRTIDSKRYEKLDEIWSELDFWYQSMDEIFRQNEEEYEINNLVPHVSMKNSVKYLYIASSGSIQIPPSISDIRLRKFFKKFIQPFFESSNLHIRGIAIKCGASLAMRHQNMASIILTTSYRQLITNQNVQIWNIALAALTEVSNLHKIRITFNDGENDVPLDAFIIDLIGSINHPELISTLAKGVGFMILSGYIQNPLLIGKILVHYFNPKSSILLQQILHVLFEIMETQVDKFVILVRSLRSALELIAKAPHESGMHEIKIADLVGLVVSHTRDFPAHQMQIANILLNMIERNIPVNLKRDLSKVLPSLRISVDENMHDMLIDSIENILCDAEQFIKTNVLAFKEKVIRNTYSTQDSSQSRFSTVEGLNSSSRITERDLNTTSRLFEIPSRDSFNSTQISNSSLDTIVITEKSIISSLMAAQSTSRNDSVLPRQKDAQSNLRFNVDSILAIPHDPSENKAKKLKQQQPIRPVADKENQLINPKSSQASGRPRRIAFLNAVNKLNK